MQGDTRSHHSHSNAQIYYKQKNNNNQSSKMQNPVSNMKDKTLSSHNKINYIEKVLPNQWMVDSSPKIQDDSNKTNPVPGINVTRLGTGGFPTRSSQVYTMNGCGLENPFSNQSLCTGSYNSNLVIEDLFNLSASPINLNSGDTITSENIKSLFNSNVCIKSLRYNTDTTIAPNAIQKTNVNHIPDCILSKESYGNEAYWEKMNINVASIKNDMARLVEIVLEGIINKSNHLKFQFTPYISPIKSHALNSNITLKTLLDARKLYKENTKIASAIREDSQVYRLLFEFAITDVYFEEKDLVSMTSNSFACNSQRTSNNFNHVEITVACSRESSSDTTLIYVGSPDATNISAVGNGYPETLLNKDKNSEIISIFSSRSSIIPCSDQYSTVLKCDSSTDKEIVGLGLCKVDDNFNTPIYVPPSLFAIVGIKDSCRVKKVKVNVKGTDIDGSIPRINIFETGISNDKEKCLYATGYANNWIEITYTLENRHSTSDPSEDDEGNYMIIEIPHVNPFNICVVGALIYYSTDTDSEEYVKEVEVVSDNIELTDTTTLIRNPIPTSRLTPSLSRIGSSIASVRSNSIKSLPVLNTQYVRSSMLTNIIGAKTPDITSDPDIPPNPIQSESINTNKLKQLLDIQDDS